MKLLFILFSIAMSGCMVGPQYQKPDSQLSEKWKNSIPSSSSSNQLWWKGLNQPKLDILIQEALDSNLDIQEAIARYNESVAFLKISDSNLYPTVNFNGAIGKYKQSENAGLGILSQFAPGVEREVDIGQLTIGATWELDFAGGLRQQKNAYLQNALSKAEETKAVQLLITSEVADAFISIASLKSMKSELDASIALLTQSEEIIRLKTELGEVSAQELLDIRSSLYQLKSKLPNYESQIEEQQNRLAVLIGKNPSDSHFDIEPLTIDYSISNPIAGLPADILRNRPDIKSAEFKLMATNAMIGANIAEYYPKVSLMGLIGQESNTFENLFQSSSNLFQRVIGIRWRLFDFGRIDSQINQAQAKNQEQLINYRKLVLKATADAETNLYSFSKSQEMLFRLREQKQSFDKSLAIVEKKYQIGEVSKFTLIQKRIEGKSIDENIFSTQMNRTKLAINCSRVLGGSISIK